MEVAIANTTSQGPLSTPGTVRSDGDLPAVICLSVVHIQLEWSPLVRLYQAEQVLALVQDTVSPDDVVRELSEPSEFSRAARRHIKDMPHILISTFEGAEPDGDTQEALPSPQSAGGDEDLPDGLALAGVDGHGDFFFNVSLQEMFESVIILVKSGVAYRHHEIKESLQTSLLPRRAFLHPEHMISLGTSTRNLYTLASSHRISCRSESSNY